jgi:molybdate transport system ATP-binding protein
MHVKSLKTAHLRIDDWQVKSDHCWAVIGRNGSGKKQLGQLLANPGDFACEYDFSTMGRTRILSFEAQQAFYEHELKIDDTDYLDHLDPGTLVRDILGIDTLPALLDFLQLTPLLDRGYRQLSSGESRKVLLAQAILDEPDYLILDEPYDSLDQKSKEQLAEFFAHLLQHTSMQLIFLLNTWSEVSNWHSHIAVIEKGQFIAQGEAAELLRNDALKALLAFDPARLPDWPQAIHDIAAPEILLRIENGSVRYGEATIFERVDLELTAGEHTLITGSNGSGKSTLLNLISGDNPQCYRNNIEVLGYKRGQGESIWDIKKRLGLVSPALHRDHRVRGSALHIVASGFFDSIGLYDNPSALQVNHAKQWLALTGLEDKANVAFREMSYGEQRLVLIARALVKQPVLLLLDEPTQGLDEINRHRLLYFLDYLSSQQHSTIVMVSHRRDEFLPIFKRHLEMDNYRGQN